MINESQIINDKEEIKRMDELFPKTDIKKPWNFIVSMSNLEKTTFSPIFIDIFDQSKEKHDNLMRILASNKILWKINFKTTIEKTRDISSIFPARTEYVISYYGGRSGKSLYLEYYDSLMKLWWEDKRITSIVFTQELTNEEYLLIKHILTISKVKGWLKEINLIVKNLSEAINIAELCISWINIESITLKYDIVDYEEELIEKVLKMFTLF